MAKYSPELKAEIISKYNQGMATSIQLARGFFHILKTELLDGLPLFEDITAFKMMVQDYIHFFNYERVSLKTKGMTLVEYRNHAMTA